MSVNRAFKIAMRVAEWATPKVQEWHRDRNMNRNEAQRHLEAGNWSEAEKFHQAALDERQHSTVNRLELILGLSEAQRRQSKLDQAEKTVNSAIAIAVQEKNDVMHSLSLEALANVQLDQGRFSEAEKTANQILQMEAARAKPDYARLASCSRSLAVALEKNERSGEAIEALKRAASHSEKAFGAAHAETAGYLHELGTLHRRGGDHAAAQLCLRKALEIQRTAAGADSKEATQALYHLAASIEESGDFDGAAAEYEKLLTLRERQVGADPAQTADAQVRLAALKLQAGHVSSARELLLNAMPSLQRSRGGPPLAQALEMLACAEDLSGRGEEAKRYREKALAAAALHAAG
jgi:tetratricopeptide (TPR) repeat protein